MSDLNVFTMGNCIWLKGECWEVRQEDDPAIKCEECDRVATIELHSVFDDGIAFLCVTCFKDWLMGEQKMVCNIMNEIWEEALAARTGED